MYSVKMKRVEGTADVKLIECVSPAKNKWRIRWDIQEHEDGSADYMEAEFLNGRPSDEVVKALIMDWYNQKVDETILKGFSYEGVQVWLSRENQFNYKAAYDLAVQTNGATLPVVFKFGTDETPVYREFSALEELTDFYTKVMLLPLNNHLRTFHRFYLRILFVSYLVFFRVNNLFCCFYSNFILLLLHFCTNFMVQIKCFLEI